MSFEYVIISIPILRNIPNKIITPTGSVNPFDNKTIEMKNKIFSFNVILKALSFN